MSWFIEHLHRDGTVIARMPVPAAAESTCFVRIGRALDNDLILDDPHCAPHHAQLEVSSTGTARLIDLGSSNGIFTARNKRVAVDEIKSDDPYRLGQTLIRVRSSTWPLAPELPLSRRALWPFALLGLVLVLAHGAWQLWLKDVQQISPPYLYGLSGLAVGLCLWSGMYALFGRLVTGVERFFSHLIIASTGYLSGMLILNLLEILGFSMSWLWPERISQPVAVIIAALTVRYHLRLADPRHWRTLRIGLVIVAALAIVIPIAQEWVSNKRFTSVQTLHSIEYPALRLAKPVSVQEFSAAAQSLKQRVDKARKTQSGNVEEFDIDEDF